jgi:hypothetical protein
VRTEASTDAQRRQNATERLGVDLSVERHLGAVRQLISIAPRLAPDRRAGAPTPCSRAVAAISMPPAKEKPVVVAPPERDGPAFVPVKLLELDTPSAPRPSDVMVNPARQTRRGDMAPRVRQPQGKGTVVSPLTTLA